MKKLISAMLILLLGTLMVVPVSAESAFDWNALEQSYYEGTSPFVSQNQVINPDNQVDYSTAVEEYRLRYALLRPDAAGEKERFSAEFQEGKSLWQMAEHTGRFYTPYMDEEGVGTAIVDKDGTFGQAFCGDNGDAYKLVLTGRLKKQLNSSLLVPADTAVYKLYIPDICAGVFFTDGISEYFYIQHSNFKSIKEDFLYASADIVDAIVKDASIKPAPPVILSYDENGELIPPDTGMGGPQQEEPSASLEWVIALSVSGALLITAALIILIKKRTAKR